jgi:hypothetical protein
MEKYLLRGEAKTHASTFDLLADNPLTQTSKPFVLGVLGNSSAAFWSKETIESLMETLTGEQEKMPVSVLLPNEGNTSLLLQVWGERKRLDVKVYDADWKRLGRRARALRDSRIQKESSHLLIFLGGRSDYYETLAIRQVKKGMIVYGVDPESKELIEFVADT